MGRLSESLTLPTPSESGISSIESFNPSSLRGGLKGKKDPEQKTLDFYLSKEEQEDTRKSERSLVTDIADLLGNLSRPFYGTTAGIDELIKSMKYEDESILKTAKDIGDEVWKGLKLEKKTTPREVARTLAPSVVKWAEDNTQIKVWGEEFDILTPVMGAAEVFGDPLTYIPFGKPLAWVGKGAKASTAASAKVARKILGNEAVDKITDVAFKKIITHFDKKALVKHLAPSDTKSMVDGVLQTYYNSAEAAKSLAVRTGQKISKTGEKTGLFWKTQKIMKRGESKQLSDAFHEMGDEMGDLIRPEVARRLGVKVEDVISLRTVDNRLDEIAQLSGKDRELAEKAILESVDAMKGEKAKTIATLILEDRGLKREAHKIVNTELNTTLAVGQARFFVARRIFKDARKSIAKEMADIQKASKAEFKLTSDLLNADVMNSLKSVKTLSDDLATALNKEVTPEVLKSIDTNMDLLRGRLQNLQKYQNEVTKGVQGFRKSDVKLQRINALVRNLQKDVSQEALAAAAFRAGKMTDRISTSIKGLSKELNAFRKARTFEFRSIKGDLTAAKKANQEISKDLNSRMTALMKERDDLHNYFKAELINYRNLKDKATRLAGIRETEYHKAFRALKTGQVYQESVLALKGERDALIHKYANQLPEHLRQPFLHIRELLDEQYVKIATGPDPLLKLHNPMYFPRRLDPESLEGFAGFIPKGGSKGFTKARKFENTFGPGGYKEWIEATGKKMDDDAVAVVMHYMHDSEMALARHTLERELRGIFKVGENADLPKDVQATLQYFYKGTGGRGLIGKMYYKLLNAQKATLTVINPAFYGRNILGFPFIAATNLGKKAFNPKNYSDSLLLKMGKEGAIVTNTGEKISYQTIRDAAEKSGYWGASFTRGDITRNLDALLKRYNLKNPLDALKWTMANVFNTSQHVEDFGRYGALIGQLRSGKPMAEALKLAKEAMFDYNMINSPADKALQSLFGFYVFSRRNLPQQFKGVLNSPKDYALLTRAIDHISNREKLSQAEIDHLNGYEKEQFKIFGHLVDGIREMTTLGFLPQEEAYRTLNSITNFKQFRREFAGRLNPTLQALLDFFYSKQSFYGTDFGTSLPAKMTPLIPKPLQKVLGFEERERPKWRGGQIVGKEKVLYGDPDTIFAVRNLPLGNRFVNDLSGLVGAIQEGKPVRGIVRYTTGVYKKDMDLSQRTKIQDIKEKKALRRAAEAKGAAKFEAIYSKDMEKKKKRRRRRD